MPTKTVFHHNSWCLPSKIPNKCKGQDVKKVREYCNSSFANLRLLQILNSILFHETGPYIWVLYHVSIWQPFRQLGYSLTLCKSDPQLVMLLPSINTPNMCTVYPLSANSHRTKNGRWFFSRFQKSEAVTFYQLRTRSDSEYAWHKDHQLP